MERLIRLGGVVAALALFAACTDGEPEPPPPTPVPTESASAEPTPTPTPTPQTAEEQAVAAAIETYEAFVHAAHAFANDPADDELLEALLLLSVDDSPAESAIHAEAEYYRENQLRGEGFPTIKRVAASQVDLSKGAITLNSCVDNRALKPIEEGVTPPDFTIETTDLRLSNGRWQVYLLEATPSEC